MEIKAQFVKALPEKTGQGKNGAWVSQDFIISTGGQYPKEVCMSLFNKSELIAGLRPGDMITCKFDPESKEYNGRYFTNLRCFAIERESKPVQQQAATQYIPPFAPPAAQQPVQDDLPF